MRERNINFFVEDDGHGKFLTPMVQRFANQYGIQIKIKIGNSTGGRGRVVSELKRYIRDLERGKENRKFDRDRYKRLLLNAVRNTGRIPILGGMEHAEALVNIMDLQYLEKTEESLGKFLKELRHKFQEWERSEHTTPQETSEDQSPDPENPQP